MRSIIYPSRWYWFLTPRVGKGLLRGGKEKRDENGKLLQIKTVSHNVN